MSNNTATDCGGGIVFFSGDGSGSLTIQSSLLSNNTGPTESKGFPGIYYWTSTGQNDTPHVDDPVNDNVARNPGRRATPVAACA